MTNHSGVVKLILANSANSKCIVRTPLFLKGGGD